MKILQLDNVSKTYNAGSQPLHVLKKINLEIEKGDFIAIMGPSGSGKSTLMHIAGCLDTPTSGKVIFENKDISKEGFICLQAHSGEPFEIQYKDIKIKEL